MGCQSSAPQQQQQQQGNNIKYTLTSMKSLKSLTADDSISKDEFTALILNEKLGLSKEQIKVMFEYADKNSCGSLTVRELNAVIGPAKKSAMNLPVRIIVPSTQDVSGRISEEAMEKRCDEVIVFMSNTFGGATATAPQRGAYRANSGEIIFEEVVSVTSFCTMELWKENVKDVNAYVKEICGKWGQEAIGLDFNGHLEYVYATDPTAEQLWNSVVPRFRKRSQISGKIDVLDTLYKIEKREREKI